MRSLLPAAITKYSLRPAEQSEIQKLAESLKSSKTLNMPCPCGATALLRDQCIALFSCIALLLRSIALFSYICKSECQQTEGLWKSLEFSYLVSVCRGQALNFLTSIFGESLRSGYSWKSALSLNFSIEFSYRQSMRASRTLTTGLRPLHLDKNLMKVGEFRSVCSASRPTHHVCPSRAHESSPRLTSVFSANLSTYTKIWPRSSVAVAHSIRKRHFFRARVTFSYASNYVSCSYQRQRGPNTLQLWKFPIEQSDAWLDPEKIARAREGPEQGEAGLTPPHGASHVQCCSRGSSSRLQPHVPWVGVWLYTAGERWLTFVSAWVASLHVLGELLGEQSEPRRQSGAAPDLTKREGVCFLSSTLFPYVPGPCFRC